MIERRHVYWLYPCNCSQKRAIGGKGIVIIHFEFMKTFACVFSYVLSLERKCLKLNFNLLYLDASFEITLKYEG